MSFYGVTDLWTYTAGALGIILLPGPNSLYVLSVASARGVKAGYRGALGVFLGDAILLAFTALGSGGLLRTYPALFATLKYAGALYLAWVGINLLYSTWQTWRTSLPLTSSREEGAVDMKEPFKRALLISLLNPKAILFLLSFFVQFIDPDYENPVIPFFILSTIVMVFSALYLSALIFSGARLAHFFHHSKRLSASLSCGVGVLFMWFGIKLAGASLS